MSWLEAGDWAEEMSQKLEERRVTRLRVAARHFQVDLYNIQGDRHQEDQLLARYEATGQQWPPFDLDIADGL